MHDHPGDTGERMPLNTVPQGYLHPEYARSLAAFGIPRALPECGGWVLVRDIPECGGKDAMGCYPLFVCNRWDSIDRDLTALANDIVSLVLVSDPFSGTNREFLSERFSVVRPFKRHLVISTERKQAPEFDRHHLYYARRSLREMETEIISRPQDMLEEWTALYRNLIARHGISGIQAFSREAFRIQLEIPGLCMIAGRMKGTGELAGMHLVIRQNDHAYSHLAAFSAEGYRISAAYGIYLETIRYLEESGVSLFDLGAAAGSSDNPDDGLARFKKGWANDERMVYLCGAVLNPDAYERACAMTNRKNADWFPEYRDPASGSKK